MKISKSYPKRIKYSNGMRFNNFILLEETDTVISKNGNRYKAWKCLCDCGVEFIGRVDSKIGYIETNVVSCCRSCNSAKGDLLLSDFENWINNLIKHKLNTN